MEEQETLQGSIERITFHSHENAFTVAKLSLEDSGKLITLVGEMPSIKVGETVRVVGKWIVNPIHGKQLQIEKVFYYTPKSKEAIKKYLESGLIKGLGPKYAKNIIEKFGEKSLEIIDQNPDALLEVEGIGRKRVQSIKDCWKEQKVIRKLIIFLQQFHVSPNLAQKIFKTYGKNALEVVKENPYAIATAIRGVGFKTADTLAQKMGISSQSPQRIQAGILYALSELSQDGHMCYLETEFLTFASELLELTEEQVKEQIEPLDKEEKIILLPLPHQGNLAPFIWLKNHYISERGIAKEFARLRSTPSPLRSIDATKAIEWGQKELNIELAEMQKSAISKAIDEKFSIITGGPGTGKSTITKVILTIYKKIQTRIMLAAPTGKAAKRLTEITGQPAKTIHSLLEYDFRIAGFKKNKEDPLECDLIIVDEASMIDSSLIYQFLRALPDGCKVILIGDTHQLPSVGPGNVLKDFISSEKAPFTFLNEIFRQGKGSQIVSNAHRINKGSFPELYSPKDGDFFFVEAKEKELVLETITHLASARVPKKFKFDPLKDIQILSPMRKGVIGCDNLNLELQKALNPQAKNSGQTIRGFYKGDKVMQLKNNYKKEVFNGDVGVIKEILFSDEEVWVQMDDKKVIYSFSELDDLTLAYAVSIHKFQGSECPCIIMPIHNSHFMMLQRNLIYTGITRGKQLVIVVGTKQAIAMAVKNDSVKKRYTGLLHALQSLVPFDLPKSQGARALGMGYS
ncbi:ATP-dependent RecD-like DNA helicase [Chlamydiales bacterium SCGC AB-751-O23]|jgi:exodeoxyribonuclease V alpha subunit|nr:ATP-dependent RecD-like DNA helicase [Chlamydiales bacterium SCGC AB-751-O23]